LGGLGGIKVEAPYDKPAKKGKRNDDGENPFGGYTRHILKFA
jgi:hypothetical protein